MTKKHVMVGVKRKTGTIIKSCPVTKEDKIGNLLTSVSYNNEAPGLKPMSDFIDDIFKPTNKLKISKKRN